MSSDLTAPARPTVYRIESQQDARDKAVRAAVGALRDGRLVGLPTETVYGLAADARNAAAVAAIYRAKGRPANNPLIVHMASAASVGAIAEVPALAARAADAFWPGPLTMVLPLRARAGIAPAALAGLSTVAVRVPARPVARDILEAFAGPVVAPSANRSGRITATTAQHVVEDLGDAVAVIVDDGPSQAGIESTIVDFSGPPRILRTGAVTVGDLERTLQAAFTTGPVVEKTPVAPGMLASHYAPSAALRLDVVDVRSGEALLALGPGVIAHADRAVAVRNLSPTGDLAEAAHNLFAMLRQLDGSAPVIAVAAIPEVGLGAAINDRLRRAAAPRDGDQVLGSSSRTR